MSVGLFFLAQDEFFSFHENFDKWIHELTGMQKTEWTTQIDTLVLLSYVAVAIGCLWRYNAEIRECSPYWKLFLVSGLCVAVTAMLCDGFANLKSTHQSWFDKNAAMSRISKILSLANLLFFDLFDRVLATAFDIPSYCCVNRICRESSKGLKCVA